MKFGVLALDYDGTIATDGTLNADFRVAIRDARAHGIAVVLVIRKAEQSCRLGCVHDIHDALAKPIRERYEFAPETT
jgi:hypothetical protein